MVTSLYNLTKETVFKKLDPYIAAALKLDPTKEHKCEVITGATCKFCGKDYERREYDYYFENGCCSINKRITRDNHRLLR